MNTMNLSKRFISWRIRGLFVAEKRLKSLLQADTKEGASDKEQNEIITLELINDENQK